MNCKICDKKMLFPLNDKTCFKCLSSGFDKKSCDIIMVEEKSNKMKLYENTKKIKIERKIYINQIPKLMMLAFFVIKNLE